jgi:hypothetical protein
MSAPDVATSVATAAATSCEPMGNLEYVVETQRRGNVEMWFVVRPHQDLAKHYARCGVVLLPNCRVVVEAGSLRPLGLLPEEPPEPPSSSGFNPYFDRPPP